MHSGVFFLCVCNEDAMEKGLYVYIDNYIHDPGKQQTQHLLAVGLDQR